MRVPPRHTLKREQPRYPRNLIGPIVRKLRAGSKPPLSQEDLCGRVAKHGVTLTRTQVAKIEAGRRPVFDYEVAAIAKALRIKVDGLLTD